MNGIANTVLMVRPNHFRSNEQTAINNYYQQQVSDDTNEETLETRAQLEFDQLVEKLTKKGINVIVYEPNDGLDTPDSHFPNNWISFHQNKTVILYPMFAKNRRLEKRPDVISILHDDRFEVKHIIDYSFYEDLDLFMEGTGSLVLDRQNKIAYAALSKRTDHGIVNRFAKEFDYQPVVFTANQTVKETRRPIYHTNVMMCVADKYAVVCLSSIDNEAERQIVIESLKSSGKAIINITEEQVNRFAGNMIQLTNTKGEPFLVMSSTALNSLEPDQKSRLESYNSIIDSNLETIETYGGGSARCMITEVFLPKK